MESEQRARCVACAGFLRRSVFVLFLSFSDFFLFFFWLFISAFYFFCDFETRHYKMQSCFYLTDSKVKDPSTYFATSAQVQATFANASSWPCDTPMAASEDVWFTNTHTQRAGGAWAAA